MVFLQVITEERGLSLDKVQPEMLGTAKKVCASKVFFLAAGFCPMRKLLFSWTDVECIRSVSQRMRPSFCMGVEIRSSLKNDARRYASGG